MKALGLKRIGSEKIHEDTPVIRGMIKKVQHLVNVEEIEE
jgi:large subunit ribosomal protein L30